MMQRQSPPKHRHDGTSPLPLGMDWSPPPRKWKIIKKDFEDSFSLEKVHQAKLHNPRSPMVTTLEGVPCGINIRNQASSWSIVLGVTPSLGTYAHLYEVHPSHMLVDMWLLLMTELGIFWIEVKPNYLIPCKNGRDTVWPHDSGTGWSYCVTIPSWVVRPKTRDSEPVVSKKAFPKKNLPPAPPKGLLRIKSRALLEEVAGILVMFSSIIIRRSSLEEWMTRLLSDIDLSRSVAVASFLELEVAARTFLTFGSALLFFSAFQDENQSTSETNASANSTASPLHVHPNSSLSVIAGSTSLTSENGSDTPYETSEIGTPSLGRDNSSEGGTEDLSLDEDLTSPIEKLVKYGMSNIDEGLFMGQAILEQLEGLPRHTLHAREINNVVGNNLDNGNASKAAYHADNWIEHFSEPEHGKVIGHARKLSNESVGSDINSLRGGEFSNSGFKNSFVEGPLDHLGGPEISRTMEGLGNTDFQSSDVQLVLPVDQRYKMNRVLMTMQRRLITAKTDMEDLISRLNQEITVKDYLATKVQQEYINWDMEELRRKSFEMELKLKSQQDEKLDTEPTNVSVTREKSLLQELDVTKMQLDDLLKRHEELEVKSKADIKVLVKEVKSLRSSQAELKKELSQSQKEKSEAERLLQLEKKECGKHAKTARQKLLHECEVLRNRLQECSINFLDENGDRLVVDSSSISDALDLLVTSDNQIGVLLAEVQLSAQNDYKFSDDDHKIDDETRAVDDELRNILKDIFIDNAKLRKQVNSVLRYSLKMNISTEKDDDEDGPSAENVQNTNVER
ncbi:hypothetical protein TEA_015875 [Camellia sinensis var. sinensis]|uniref:PX domain-containing protein n=1 Tax=Camellia sinensis var. sinensis TaxID=542762 RepID=A0A4S4DEN5_CAMSN|nr:hypothetical protein TEA_015875 [Camellia sinensis var. sinensis]